MELKFNKGDKVVLISKWNSKGAFYARRLTIESWGKKQGTATYEQDGKFIKSRIYTENANRFVNNEGFRFFSPEFYFLVEKDANEEKVIERIALQLASEWCKENAESRAKHLEVCKARNDNEDHIQHEERVVAEYRSYVPSFAGFK